MRRSVLLALSSMLWLVSIAQEITPVQNALSFKNVNIEQSKSLDVSFFLNSQTENYDVTWQIIGQGFSTSVSDKVFERGIDSTIAVTFSPEDNLAYRATLFIAVNGVYQTQVSLTGNGRLANAYYANSFNKWDKELLDALQNITSSGQKSLGYSRARDEMYSDLDNYDGEVTCAYTGRTASFNSRSGANNNDFNCEHTWPQSLFCSDDESVMRADIHHLFSTDSRSNSRRSNLPFGIVEGNANWENGGSKASNSVFEPRDEQKGATARAMMYFAMRYGDCSRFWGAQGEALRQWHKNYPPSEEEQARNEGIFDLQNNRNPFVDYPAFTNRIISFSDTKRRTYAAEASLVTNTIDAFANRTGDSAIYHVYVANTGNAELILENMQTDVANYRIVKEKALGGEYILIRFAQKNPASAGKRATLYFENDNVESLSVSFNAFESTAIEELDLQELFMIRGKYLIYTGDVPLQYLRIYNLSGQTVYSGQRTAHKVKVDGFESSVFIINAVVGEAVIRQKLLLH